VGFNSYWLKQTFNNYLGPNGVLSLDEDAINVAWNATTPGDTKQLWTVQEAVVNVFITNQKNAFVFQVLKGISIKFDHEGALLVIAQSTLLVEAPYTGDKNQQWFWDDQVLRSSEYPETILVISSEDSDGFRLEEFNSTESQKLSMKNSFLVPGHCSNSTSPACEQKEYRIGRARDFFFIVSKLNAKVLETSNNTFIHEEGAVVASEVDVDSNEYLETSEDDSVAFNVDLKDYRGDDSQLWFWDGDSIRSKINPDKVLSTCDQDDSHTMSCVRQFDAKDSQRWSFVNGTFLSNDQSQIQTGEHLETVGGRLWSLNTHRRVYFTITSRVSAKVLTATDGVSLVTWPFHGGDNQLWFWDDDLIRSKQYPDKVLDLHIADFENEGWGKVYLSMFNNGSNQQWKLENESIVCSYADLHLEIADNERVGATLPKHEINQMWSFNTDQRTYFRISNGVSAKVLIADSNSHSINVGEYSVAEDQLWFWDGDSIRSKAYPDQVMDLNIAEYESSGWGSVYLHPFNAGDNQRWQPNNGQLVSSYDDLKLDVDGGRVGGKNVSQNEGQNWHLNTGERVFFVLKNNQSEMVVCANQDDSIRMCDYAGVDAQQWFWDGDAIRSKQYQDKIMDLNVLNYDADGTWGNVYLHSFNGGNNQRWYSEADKLVTFHKNLAMSLRNSEIGGCALDACPNQLWNLFIPSQTSAEAPKPSCANKIEQKIYNVVQWIPFVSTIWDLGTSIGYGVAGCSSVAKERAIDLGLNVVADVVIGATLGVGSGIVQGVKKGLEAIAEGGFKQTLKAAIKELPRGLLKLGTRSLSKTGLEDALTNSLKFAYREALQNNFLFTKNILKAGTSVLKNPGNNFLKKNICKNSGLGYVLRGQTFLQKMRGYFM
jgi:hypothetical protein